MNSVFQLNNLLLYNDNNNQLYYFIILKESNEVLKKQEKVIINKLSVKLRNDLILDIQGKYLSNIPLFNNLKERDKVSNIMEEYLYSPGEIIFKQGDIDDCSLYYLVKGSVQIIFLQNSLRRDDTVISVKGKQEYFGEISFITGNPRSLSAKASDFCRVYKINRQKFIEIIKDNEYDFENFQMVREAIFLNNNYKFCSIKCLTCQQGNHYSAHCPRSHLTLTKQVVISRYNFSIPHIDRIQFTRKRKRYNYKQQTNQMLDAVIEINKHESLFDILDEIEQACNNIEFTDEDMHSENSNFPKKSQEEATQKSSRYRSSDSNKQGKIIQIQNQINEDGQVEFQTIRPTRGGERQFSNNSLSPKHNDQRQSTPIQSKPIQPYYHTINKSKSSSSEQPSQQSSKSQSSSDSSSQSSSNSLSSSTKKSFSTNNSQKNKESNLAKKPLRLVNDAQNNQEEVQKSQKKPSQQFIQSRTLDQDKKTEQQINSNIILSNIKAMNSQTKVSSKIDYEKEDNNQYGNYQRISSLQKIFEKSEYDKQFSLSSNSSSNKARNKSQGNNNYVQQIFNPQNEPLKSAFWPTENRQQGRITANPQMRGRSIMRQSINPGEQINLLQQSVMEFLNKEQKKIKNQKSFVQNNANIDQPNGKKISQITLSSFLKYQNQDNKRQSNNKYMILPSILQQDDTQSYLKNMLGIKQDQKLEIGENSDNVNYIMLQTFDKAKIFKHYLPHFNYPEIVEEWIKYQQKFNKNYNHNRSSFFKKKGRQNQSKRKLQDI